MFLSLFLVSLANPTYTITSASGGSCEDSGYSFTLSGTTDTILGGSETVAVTLSTPEGATATCKVGEVTVTPNGGRLRNLAESMTISCTSTSTFSADTLTVSTVSIGSVSANIENSVVTINSVTCPTTAESVSISDVSIVLTSVSQKNVVLTLTPPTANKDTSLTAAGTITGLSLVDSDTFSQSLTCSVAAAKLSSVTCTMTTAATDGTKYHLSGTATYNGKDTITFTLDTTTEVTAATSSTSTPTSTSNSSSSTDNGFYLKTSLIFFIFPLLL